MTTTRLPKDALPIQEAAARYMVTRRTLDRWATAGRLRIYKQTGDTRAYVRASAVERLLREPPAPRGKRGKWREQQQQPPQ
ncbi:MAG: MerR family DNA-binding transcriptional regulator [Anaerolineales bacterium]|nr:MerR family DNA-binding transcriptional regulator [Anaerolineales bacterium]